MQQHAAFTPRRRDDRGLYAVAEHAVEAGRFVILVEQTAGNQKQTDLPEQTIVERALDVQLLDLDFARIVRRAHRVLDLEFADHSCLLVELIGHADDEAADRFRGI